MRVRYPIARQTASEITFHPIHVNEDGIYSASLRFANNTDQAIQMNLYINHALDRTLTFVPTASFPDGRLLLTIGLPLTAGNNTVTFRPYTPGQFIYLNYMEVAKSSTIKMFIVAHPDDELLLYAGSILTALRSGYTVKVVVITNGNFRSATLGLTRIIELQNGLLELGLHPASLIIFGYPDAHLRYLYGPNFDTPRVIPYLRSPVHAYGNHSVGLPDFGFAHRGTSSLLNGRSVTDDIKRVLLEFRPTTIYTHMVYDGHSDHNNTYRFVIQALRELNADEEIEFLPTLNATILGFPPAGGMGWSNLNLARWANHWPFDAPRPSGEIDNTQWPFPPLPYFDTRTSLYWADRVVVPMTDEMIALKRAALNHHITQGGAAVFSQLIRIEEFYWTLDLEAILAEDAANP